MNIFTVDSDPYIAASYLHDKHILKMPLETSQMLSTCHHFKHSNPHPNLYKPCFVKHPCTQWVMESAQNYFWTLQHFEAISKMFFKVYGKVHGSFKKLYPILCDIPDGLSVSKGLTPFAKAVGKIKKYMDIENPVDCYRAYYIGEKLTDKNGNLSTWKGRGKPEWIV